MENIGECLALDRGEIGKTWRGKPTRRGGILSQDSCALLGIWASPRCLCRPLMTQGATARARLGAKSRTGLLLDNANENVTGCCHDGGRCCHNTVLRGGHHHSAVWLAYDSGGSLSSSLGGLGGLGGSAATWSRRQTGVIGA